MTIENATGRWAVGLELANGQDFNLSGYLCGICKGQNLRAWYERDQIGFDAWVRGCIQGVLDNVAVTIKEV